MTSHTRAEAMARRVARTAGRLGLDHNGLATLRLAFDVGMAPRLDRGLPDHHPDYLHPSRTALILMDDARVHDLHVLAAALVTETRDASLRPDPAALRGLVAARHIVAEVPDPARDSETLLESLLGSSSGARLVAVAERLDHARHLHLREREEWLPYHADTFRVYTPVARRTHPALAGRLEWWCATFERRFLGS